ncbi:hypothetical protein [Nocardioides sp. NPDC127503]|uniref:hypothetical protein n=1 Tax=Nocardioides sp. NPDC127503 TaxID=3154516 RepID=UPI003331C04C
MKDTRTDVATRLREFAENPLYAPRSDDLRSLADSLTDDEEDSWVGIDLVRSFSGGSILMPRHQAWLGTILGLLAGASVFFPVAWTWWSLSAATNAYDSLLTSGTERGRTFLALWTVGFDGELSGAHRLFPMAIVSVSLVILAILLVAAHRMVAERDDARHDDELARLEAALQSALTAAQRLLNERRVDSADHIESLVKRSVRQLREAHENTRIGTAELKKAADQLGRTIPPLLTSATTAASDLSAAVLATQTMQTDLKDMLTELRAAVVTHSEDLQSGTAKSLADLGATVGGHVGSLGHVTQKALDGLSTEVSKVADRTDTLGQELHDLSSGHATASAGISAALDDVQKAIRSLDGMLAGHDSAMQAQVSELSAARDAAERMLHQLELNLVAR